MHEASGVKIVEIIVGAIADRSTDYDFKSFDGTPTFMRVVLSPILFDAILSVDKRRFRKYARPIWLLAFRGT